MILSKGGLLRNKSSDPFVANIVYSLASYSFNGSSDYIQIPTSIFNTVNLASWTVEAYVTQDTQIQPPERIIFTTYNFPTQADTFVGTTQRIGYIPPTTGFSYLLPQNQRIHWAVSKSAGKLLLHLNGIFQNSIDWTPTQTASNNYFGGSPGDNNLGSWFFKGLMEKIRITNVNRYNINTNFIPPI